jgi:hypothetical protein
MVAALLQCVFQQLTAIVLPVAQKASQVFPLGNVDMLQFSGMHAQ